MAVDEPPDERYPTAYEPNPLVCNCPCHDVSDACAFCCPPRIGHAGRLEFRREIDAARAEIRAELAHYEPTSGLGGTYDAYDH